MNRSAMIAAAVVALALVAPTSALGLAIKSSETGSYSGVVNDTAYGFNSNVFHSVKYSVRAVGLNQTAGNLSIYATGGKRMCRARLVFVDRDPSVSGTGGVIFAVRFQSGASKRARGVCRPSNNGVRMTHAIWDTSDGSAIFSVGKPANGYFSGRSTPR